MTKSILIFAIVFIAATAQISLAQASHAPDATTTTNGEQTPPPLDESQVFEWWDDGIITPEEAEEIFSRLEEENYDEACLLAELYAQEPCISNNFQTQAQQPKRPSKNRKTKQTTKQAVPSIIPHGSIAYKAQYNSEGHLKKQHKELQIQFYYFKLRLGSQELLSYHRDNFEAHFGQISTLELHSHLPLDTLWGTALFFPVGMFRFGAALDTSKTFHSQIEFAADRHNKIAASYWKLPNANAASLQASTTLGQISAWYQFGQDRPLVKIQLQSEKSHLAWKTTAYLHGDSVPQGLNLSKGIVENWLWASQTVNLQFPEALNTVVSAKIRTLSPVGTDSVSARFKMSLATGPQKLRASLDATCVEASENCGATEWKGTIESSWEHLTLKSSAKIRFADGTNPPKIELGATYRQSKNTFIKLVIALPDANPAQNITLQNEIKIENDHFGCDFLFAFKKKKTKKLGPNYAHLQAKFKF